MNTLPLPASVDCPLQRRVLCDHEELCALAAHLGPLAASEAQALEDLALAVPNPGESLLRTEQRLDTLSQAIRLAWMKRAHRSADDFFKSPQQHPRHRLPFSPNPGHTYERNVPPTELERRLGEYRSVPPGWHAAHVVFSSGMAALASFYQSYLAMVHPTQERPFQLLKWGDYFETRMLFELLKNEAFRWRSCPSQTELAAGLHAGADLLHLEPVRYDWELSSIDLSALIETLRSCSLNTLVADTTLTADVFPMDRLLTETADAPPDVVVQVSSGLKLHQLGLELSNVGLLSIFVAESRGGQQLADRMAGFLRKFRTIFGSGLSLDQMALLDLPLFLERSCTERYSQRVFANNAALARAVAPGGLFAQVRHPSSSPGADGWAAAPFVVFHLQEDDLENHGLLLSVLQHEARARGLLFQMGSSFGFRSDRFECIIPNLSQGRGLFKVAMGARHGASSQRVRELLAELAACPDFRQLRERYPTVTPVDVRGGAA